MSSSYGEFWVEDSTQRIGLVPETDVPDMWCIATETFNRDSGQWERDKTLDIWVEISTLEKLVQGAKLLMKMTDIGEDRE